jgi:protein SCO1
VKYFVAAIAFVASIATSQSAIVDLAPQRGAKIASIQWTDENGRVRKLEEFSGYPLILLPIYTRCPGPCLQNVDRLKTALTNSTGDPRQFRVLLFSFDATDTPAALAKYRERENIPLAWSIGAGSQANIDTLLDSIGMQIGKAGKEFTHPNLLLFLNDRLEIAKWIYGTGYRDADVDLALEVAGGRGDWLGQYAQQIYALLLFAASLFCVALFYYLAQLTSRRAAAQVVVNPS